MKLFAVSANGIYFNNTGGLAKLWTYNPVLYGAQ